MHGKRRGLDLPRLGDVRRTTAFQLTIGLGLTFAAGVVLLLGLIYYQTDRLLTARSDHILLEKLDRLRATPPDGLVDAVRDELGNRTDLEYVALLSASGEKVVGNVALRGPFPLGQPFDSVERGSSAPLRVLAVRTAARETLMVGRDVSQIVALRRGILIILIGSGGVILTAVGLAAVALSLEPLRRIRDAQRVSRVIAAGQLDLRMTVSHRRDELDQFAATVNVMIEEVGRVLAQTRQTTEAIAHDLRTPLTRVRGRLVAARGLVDPTGEIDAATEDLDSVLARFAALLRIAEIEASGRRAGFTDVDLGDLARRVAELYEPLAEAAGKSLDVTVNERVRVHADDELLFEAVSNLVDNAIKFARSRVIITVAPKAIAVVDDGPGIAPGDRAAMLDRFRRGAHAIGTPGHGLGLGIVAAIAHLHGFALELADAEPGLDALLITPPSAPAR